MWLQARGPHPCLSPEELTSPEGCPGSAQVMFDVMLDRRPPCSLARALPHRSVALAGCDIRAQGATSERREQLLPWGSLRAPASQRGLHGAVSSSCLDPCPPSFRGPQQASVMKTCPRLRPLWAGLPVEPLWAYGRHHKCVLLVTLASRCTCDISSDPWVTWPALFLLWVYKLALFIPILRL